MGYALTDLITMFRQDMQDEAAPYLWSDGEVKRYLAEAQDYFMHETMYMASTETFTYSADDLEVTFPEYITQIRQAYDASENILPVINKPEWDMLKRGSSWRSDTGDVTDLVSDLSFHKIRLFPIPEEDGTFYLDVFRVAKTLIEDDAELEVTERPAQRVILTGARAVAYKKEDIETLDDVKAQKYRAEFEIQTSDFYARMQNARRTPRNVAYGGIAMDTELNTYQSGRYTGRGFW